jgi:serine/threonine-protein kinase RsbW
VPPDVRVSVPASSEHVQVLRNVAAAVAARAGCTIDTLADLRLAVDEAATRLLHDAPGAEVLVLEADREPGRLRLVVAAVGAASAWPPPGLDGSMGWQILSALVEEADAHAGPEGPAISFAVRSDG